MNLEICPITGTKIESKNLRSNLPIENTYTYQTPLIGAVTLSNQSWIILERNEYSHKYILAGYCRNTYILKREVPKLQIDFIDEGYKSLEIPVSFEEKCEHLLEYLFEMGGKESKSFTLNTKADYTIAYSTDADEFKRIVEHLELQGYINWKRKNATFDPKVIFFETRLTIDGIEQAKKSLPVDPMIRLVKEEFRLASDNVNEKVNHAIKLFHTKSNTDNMRSAAKLLALFWSL